MESSSQVRSNDVRIGTAGWSYKDWDGIFYPPGMQRRKQHPLEYMRVFSIPLKSTRRFMGRSSRN